MEKMQKISAGDVFSRVEPIISTKLGGWHNVAETCGLAIH